MSNLIAHWPLDDNLDTDVVLDATGNHNGAIKDATGTPTTAFHHVEGKVGGALDFDGTDDYIEIPDSDDFSFGDGVTDSPFSISAWIYMDSAASFPIINKHELGVSREWEFYIEGGKLFLLIHKLDSDTIWQGRYFDTSLSAGQWYHIVATYDGSGGVTAHDGIKIYIDGVRKDDTDYNLGVPTDYVAMDNGTQPVHIGRVVTNYANGKIDEVRIYDKELTAAEVDSIYRSGIGILNKISKPKPPVPAGYEQVSAGPNTAVGLTIPTNARYAVIKTTSAAGHFRDDGTSPTSASGYPLAVADVIELTSAEQLADFKIICTGDDQTVLEVLYYKLRA